MKIDYFSWPAVPEVSGFRDRHSPSPKIYSLTTIKIRYMESFYFLIRQ